MQFAKRHALDVLNLASRQNEAFVSGKLGFHYARPANDEQLPTSKALMTSQNLIRVLSFHTASLEGDDSTVKEVRGACLGHIGGERMDHLQTRQVAALIRGFDALDGHHDCLGAIIEECEQVLVQTSPAHLNLLGCLLAQSKGNISKAVTCLKQVQQQSLEGTQLHRGTIMLLHFHNFVMPSDDSSQ